MLSSQPSIRAMRLQSLACRGGYLPVDKSRFIMLCSLVARPDCACHILLKPLMASVSCIVIHWITLAYAGLSIFDAAYYDEADVYAAETHVLVVAVCVHPSVTR